MGFFDKILQGLGFEDDEEEAKIPKNKPVKQERKVKNEYILNTKKTYSDLDFCEFSPASQNDVIEIINYMKKGCSVKVDFSKLNDEDIYRAIDFFQGACLALDLEPKHIQGKIFEVVGNN